GGRDGHVLGQGVGVGRAQRDVEVVRQRAVQRQLAAVVAGRRVEDRGADADGAVGLVAFVIVVIGRTVEAQPARQGLLEPDLVGQQYFRIEVEGLVGQQVRREAGEGVVSAALNPAIEASV